MRVGDKSTHKWTAEGDMILSLQGEQGRGGRGWGISLLMSGEQKVT